MTKTNKQIVQYSASFYNTVQTQYVNLQYNTVQCRTLIALYYITVHTLHCKYVTLLYSKVRLSTSHHNI